MPVDSAALQNAIRAAARATGADHLDARWESAVATGIVAHAQTPPIVDRRREIGGTIRAVVATGIATVTFRDFDEIAVRARTAVEMARAIASATPTAANGRSFPALAATEPVVAHINAAETGRAAAEPLALADKVAQMADYADLMHGAGASAGHGVVRYFERVGVHVFVDADGACVTTDRRDAAWAATAVALGAFPQAITVEHGGSTPDCRAVLGGHETAVRSAVKAAIAAATAPPARAGVWPVVMNPALAGLFVHETIGHLSEADHACDHPALALNMARGRAVAPEGVTIFDTGNVPGSRGFVAIDDEGVVARNVVLVERGRLADRLHSRETAARLGEAPTGNGRAIHARFPVLPRMRVTSLAADEAVSVADLIAEIRFGLYAVDAVHGECRDGAFTFTPAEAFVIRDGRVAERVRRPIFTGRVVDALRQIDGVANDFRVTESFGGCGKKGQAPLPIAVAAPSIRLRGWRIAPA